MEFLKKIFHSHKSESKNWSYDWTDRSNPTRTCKVCGRVDQYRIHTHGKTWMRIK